MNLAGWNLVKRLAPGNLGVAGGSGLVVGVVLGRSLQGDEGRAT